MSNISFNGNIYDKDGILTTNVAYRLYFKRNNTGSHPSIWSDIRYTEPNLNQYNINLGDVDLLGNEGVSNINDEVLLLYWIPMQDDQYSYNLTQWSVIHYILTSAQTYPQDVQILNHQTPFCSFSFNGYNVNETSQVIDINSSDDYSWVFSSIDHFQKYQSLNQLLFNKNKVPDHAIDIIWDDGTIDTNLNLSDSPFSHIYDTPDTYNIQINLSNSDNLECNQNIPVTIINNIYNGLTWNPPVCLNDSIEYIPDISGITSSITGVDYYIDDILTYENLTWDESFYHSFDIGGTHIIKQCIKYFDGFSEQVKCEEFNVIMCLVAHYEDQSYGCGLIFIQNSQIGSPPVITYQWDVSYDGDVICHVEGPEYDKFYYAFPYLGTFRVRLQVQDQYNISSYEREYDISECSGSESPGGGGGGGGSSPWIYNEYKEEIIPKITILDITTDDISNKKILIVDVIDVKEL